MGPERLIKFIECKKLVKKVGMKRAKEKFLLLREKAFEEGKKSDVNICKWYLEGFEDMKLPKSQQKFRFDGVFEYNSDGSVK